MSYAGPDVMRLLGCCCERRSGQPDPRARTAAMFVIAAERGWADRGTLKFVAVGGAFRCDELLQRADAAGLPVYEG